MNFFLQVITDFWVDLISDSLISLFRGRQVARPERETKYRSPRRNGR